MNPIRARMIASDLVAYYIGPAWNVAWSRRLRTFGECVFADKEIRLSYPLVQCNEEPVVINVILHEIAHAMVARPRPGQIAKPITMESVRDAYSAALEWDWVYGHTEAWRQVCLNLGGDGQRCFTWSDVTKPNALAARAYIGTCSICGGEFTTQTGRMVRGLRCKGADCDGLYQWERIQNDAPARS